MPAMIDWAMDLLMSRGALVEMEGHATLRAMLPRELAAALEANDWLSLRFAGGPGSDDETEWLERLGRLLPAEVFVTGARQRRPRASRGIDAAAVLDRELVIQNGIFRPMEDRGATGRYFFFGFRYTVESDETSVGAWSTCLNASANSLVHQADLLLKTVSGDLEEDPAFAIPREDLARLFPIALGGARPGIRRMAAAAEQSANRRLARDSDRIADYYRNLLRQIEKRVARRGAEPAAVEKERNRAAATELDRAIKLEDLARKYSLKIRVEASDVLVVTLPVWEITARVIRKKGERIAKFHWNPALGGIESPWCEHCLERAHPIFLCDDRLHFLCRNCFSACAGCGRQFCRVCHTRCKCGAGSPVATV